MDSVWFLNYLTTEGQKIHILENFSQQVKNEVFDERLEITIL